MLSPIVTSLRSVAARCRFDDYRAHHVGMEITEVLIGSRRGEGERIAVISVERPRFLEGVIRRGNAVRNIVLVGPGHGGAGFHCQRLWPEGEVVDRHYTGRTISPGEQHTGCQKRADGSAKHGCSDNG